MLIYFKHFLDKFPSLTISVDSNTPSSGVKPNEDFLGVILPLVLSPEAATIDKKKSN